MKIKTLVEFSDEIEVNVSSDDILGAFSEDFEPVNFMRTINAIATFLNGVPDSYIKNGLVESQRKTIKDYLLSQAKRYTNEVVISSSGGEG